MEFVETAIFARVIENLMDDESYAGLQHYLVLCPHAGVVIPEGGGLRKIRWRGKQKGKRGGVRVIYYWACSADMILFLYAYAKNRQSDLTRRQVKQLRDLVEREFL